MSRTNPASKTAAPEKPEPSNDDAIKRAAEAMAAAKTTPTPAEIQAFIGYLGLVKIKMINADETAQLEALRAKYPDFDEKKLDVEVNKYVSKIEATSEKYKNQKEIDAINKAAEENNLPSHFIGRCDECEGDPGCVDWFRNPATKQYYKADMCVKRRMKPGGDLYNDDSK